MKEVKDMLGKHFEIGDIVIHASTGYCHSVKQRLGIVTKVNKYNGVVHYTRLRDAGEARYFHRNKGWIPHKEGTIKSLIKVPTRSIIIGNCIFGTQPAMPEQLLDVVKELKGGKI